MFDHHIRNQPKGYLIEIWCIDFCFSFGSGTRISCVVIHAFVPVLTVHRTVIHCRLPFKSRFQFQNKKTNRMGWFFVLAAEPGFEPRRTESESAVLPLHNSAKYWILSLYRLCLRKRTEFATRDKCHQGEMHWYKAEMRAPRKAIYHLRGMHRPAVLPLHNFAKYWSFRFQRSLF